MSLRSQSALSTYFAHHSWNISYPLRSYNPGIHLLSMLFITIRTDMETFLISRLVTLYPMILFLFGSYFNLIPISFLESSIGAALGYGFMYFVRWIFFKIKNVEGMGLGDVELMGMIGAFLGPIGTWLTILAGSFSGIIFILAKNIWTKKEPEAIPSDHFLL